MPPARVVARLRPTSRRLKLSDTALVFGSPTMNTVLEEILRTGLTVAPSGERIRVNSAVSEGEGLFLANLVSELRPRLTLEVGLAFGVSALFICEALPAGARHIVIDPYQFSGPPGDEWYGAGLAALRRAGYENRIEFHSDPSYAVLPQLEAKGTKIDFAFIDGWHTFDFTLVDFFYIDRMLEVGGIVALHDVDMTSIRKVCEFVVTNLNYIVCAFYPALESQASSKLQAVTGLAEKSLRPDCGLVALRKISDDTRPWDFHKHF